MRIVEPEQAGRHDLARRGRPGGPAAAGDQGGACRDARPAGHGGPGRLRRGGDPADRVRPADAQDVPDGRPAGGDGATRSTPTGGCEVERTRAGPTEAEVRAALATPGRDDRAGPPEFSALKVEGQRAYDLARAGQAVELAARPVTVDRIELIAYEWPRLELEVDCGSGTYIRSIARDVGEALGCGGLVEVLVRTRIGPFRLADAIDPTRCSADDDPGPAPAGARGGGRPAPARALGRAGRGGRPGAGAARRGGRAGPVDRGRGRPGRPRRRRWSPSPRRRRGGPDPPPARARDAG